MSVVQEGYQIHRSHSRRHEFSSLRSELLRARRMLLQAVSGFPPQAEHHVSSDVPDVAASERDLVFDDLIKQRAYARFLQVERALDRMLDTSYGICRGCRNDIPLPRLRIQPHATLCAACIEERLENLSADAL
jgi:DnaK suppressor protein